MEIKKREGESPNSLIFRFTKKTQQSGVLKETRKRRFYKRSTSRIKRRASALHRRKKRQEFERAKKLGVH
jgi:ribosomal protein S21